jgi:hypothetical protein
VEDTKARAEKLVKEPKYFAHFYAFYLLGQFRERQAYRPIIELFSLPGEVSERLAEDFITDGLASVLASVAHGDTSLVKGLTENPSANEWARGSAAESLAVMVGAGELPRDEAVAYLRQLLRGAIDRGAGDFPETHLWSQIVCLGMHIYPEEMMPEIQAAFDAELIEEGYINRDNIQRALDKGREAVLKEIPSRYPLITDAVDELSEWACFEEDRAKEQAAQKARKRIGWTGPLKPTRRETDRNTGSESRPGLPPEYPSPLARSAPKLGRNDPCPCGSGKKHKKCCGGKAN